MNKKAVGVILSVVVIALIITTIIYFAKQHQAVEHQKAVQVLAFQQTQQDLAVAEKNNRKSNNANK